MFWGPSRGNPTRWCPTLATKVAPVFRRISVFQVGVILLLFFFGHFQQSWRLLVLTAPSKLGFQVEVKLLEDHRLPTGTARE